MRGKKTQIEKTIEIPDADDSDDQEEPDEELKIVKRCLRRECKSSATHHCLVCRRSMCDTHSVEIPSIPGQTEMYFACDIVHVLAPDQIMNFLERQRSGKL